MSELTETEKQFNSVDYIVLNLLSELRKKDCNKKDIKKIVYKLFNEMVFLGDLIFSDNDFAEECEECNEEF